MRHITAALAVCLWLMACDADDPCDEGSTYQQGACLAPEPSADAGLRDASSPGAARASTAKKTGDSARGGRIPPVLHQALRDALQSHQDGVAEGAGTRVE